MVDYNMPPNKKASIKLDTNAFLESRSDLNVAFSSADRDTAIFEFTVTQDKKPLLLGESNIKSSIVFIHSKGLKVRVPLEITDGMNGKISVKVPDDVLKLPGKVTSQVFVTRKTPDETQVVVAERIFSFTIQESLAWEFDGETKLNYIIEFDELEEQLTQRVVAIEQAMENLEDYVAKVKEASDKGVSDINIAKANGLQELNDLAAAKLSEITDKGEAYENIFNAIKSDVESDKQEVVENYNAFIQTHQDIVSDFQTIVSDYQELVDTKLNQSMMELDEKIEAKQLISQKDFDSAELKTEANNKREELSKELKLYIDNKLSQRYTTLWSGNANTPKTILELKENYKDFEEIVVKYNFVGGEKTCKFYKPQNSLAIHDFNLSDADGGSARFYEMGATFNDEKHLTISHNNSYLPESNKGVKDANVLSIIEIVGVKK
ncbi:BppU family phage baseplate upper protein [Staphylococcus epidermidis]|uniref:BppU family phage baseplate upper protein n=1 Tax=Staphylococcus epidermidis TaxID=1282 RepID=UPI0018827D97|nr:BppU family phage baseplate upper protein [Staphylococcus epidermidis]MBE9409807.1 BppU family phage baseplate upper protein [Staphylococcus epidermidis]MBG3866704.1 BppU family phage baseplate upper protein [Staphylococcus epidermidis]